MDFNSRNQLEAGYLPSPIIFDPIELFKQEILFLLDSKPTDVLGQYSGFDLPSLIFQTKIPAEAIEQKLSTMISQYCVYASEFTYETNVTFMEGQTSDIGIVEIIITDSDNQEYSIKYLYN